MPTLEQMEKGIQRIKLQRAVLERTLEEANANLNANELEVLNYNSFLSCVQIAAKAVQQSAHEKICSVVSKCLSVVFDSPYEFKIEFETKRNKTEANAVFYCDGNVIDDPMNASGGGILDVASFALRVSAIILSKPNKRRLLVLDEPFKFVSSQYRERIGEMLKLISEKYNIQIVMVTHIDELKTGKIIEL